MIDTAAVVAEIARLLTAGFAEEHLLAIVAQTFPDLTEQEFCAALQEATEQAEKQVVEQRQPADTRMRMGEGEDGDD
jgi:hypothetical protein